MDSAAAALHGVTDVWRAYRDTWLDTPTAGLLCGLVLAALLDRLACARSAAPRGAERTALAALSTLGVWIALRRASLVDDAFISFRYASHFARGQGLTFNPGERVEGYTNFLWTLLMGLAEMVVGVAPDAFGLWVGLAAFVVHLWVVHAVARRLLGARPDQAVFPLVAGLLAVQYTFNCFATTGLETCFTSLLVYAGLLLLIRLDGERDALFAGLCLILAVLSRPDHAVFYAVGAFVIAFEWLGPALRTSRPVGQALWSALCDARGRRRALHYAAPFALYLLHLGFRVAYYGEFLPNTYYAKSAALPYYEQGLVYSAVFYLGSHLWILGGLVLVWLVTPAVSAEQRRFKLFFVPAFALYNFYIVRVGGDFMAGRFHVSLIPMWLLAASQAPLAAGRVRPRLSRALAAASIVLCMATLVGTRLVEPRSMRWHIADEPTYYPLASLQPITVDHANARAGHLFGRLREEGFEPILATSGIGMLGYYSDVEIVDLVGLVDAHVAHQHLERRGRPGHEKVADARYVAKRAPHFVRMHYQPRRYRELTALHLGHERGAVRWYIYRYDRAMMRALRVLDPAARFLNFERYLSRYERRELPRKTQKEVRKDLFFFRNYYFRHNDDAERWQRLLRAAEARWPGSSAGL